MLHSIYVTAHLTLLTCLRDSSQMVCKWTPSGRYSQNSMHTWTRDWCRHVEWGYFNILLPWWPCHTCTVGLMKYRITKSFSINVIRPRLAIKRVSQKTSQLYASSKKITLGSLQI